MQPTIELQHVSKQFRMPVLQDISYAFYPGQLYGITGPSGSGKSTLLQIIGTLQSASAGTVTIQNTPVGSLSSREKAHLRNKTIGFVFQSFFLNSNLTALENVMLPMLTGRDSYHACQSRARSLLCELGLEQHLKQYPSQLSGGQQQRVAIARALANNPPVLLADEPTGNLDAETELHIAHLMQQLAHEQNKTVLMVTHSAALCCYTDTVLHLQDGHLQEQKGGVLA